MLRTISYIHSWLSHWEGRPREPQPTRVTPAHVRVVQGSWCGTGATTTPNTTTSSGRRYVASSRHVRPRISRPWGTIFHLQGGMNPRGVALPKFYDCMARQYQCRCRLHTLSVREVKRSTCPCVCTCNCLSVSVCVHVTAEPSCSHGAGYGIARWRVYPPRLVRPHTHTPHVTATAAHIYAQSEPQPGLSGLLLLGQGTSH